MPEPVTAVEKVEALYLLQIERLEKQVQEGRIERERDRQIFQREYQERLKETVQDYNDRKEDLVAQNDGMLGAIGRLHAENQTLKQTLMDAQSRMKRLEEDLDQVHNHVQAQMEEAHLRMDEKVGRIKEEAAREIKDLKRQIEDLKGKAKKKA